MLIFEKSFQGKRHIERGTPCQDFCGHVVTPNGWIVAAAADGVSASPMAEIGAKVAVESILDYFSDFRYSPFLTAERMQIVLRDAYNFALRRVKEREKEQGSIPYSLMTTLQAMICGSNIGLHWGQAGDGALIIRSCGGLWSTPAEQMKNPEDDSSPITLQDGPEFWQFGSISMGNVDSVLMVTDGVADAIGIGDESDKISDEAVCLLMNPSDGIADGIKTEKAYQELFFSKKDNHFRNRDKEKALTRLRSIHDDITVLLLQNEGKPVNPEATKETTEAEKLQEETTKDSLSNLPGKIFENGLLLVRKQILKLIRNDKNK